jgi:hypothetical protein
MGLHAVLDVPLKAIELAAWEGVRLPWESREGINGPMQPNKSCSLTPSTRGDEVGVGFRVGQRLG